LTSKFTILLPSEGLLCWHFDCIL